MRLYRASTGISASIFVIHGRHGSLNFYTIILLDKQQHYCEFISLYLLLSRSHHAPFVARLTLLNQYQVLSALYTLSIQINLQPWYMIVSR